MYHLTVGSRTVVLTIAYLTSYTFYYNVAHTRSAVVVEIIVPVRSVLWEEVDIKCLQHSEFLLSREIQYLLADTTAHTLVLILEIVKAACADLIVGQAEYETQYEVRFAEREKAIVHRIVDARILTGDSQCCMPIETIHSISRLTCKKADVYRVYISKHSVFLLGTHAIC